ncbi:hypothetical protein IFM89_001564 [Coptis chinensis]|uniref:Protein kinase domain-containing protein n=1 Tax=Coptis chinensis TaxID=261450 RepID=A0A835HF16_9MAGN|nr:hypothetical protein IFM89_001564 [Coptis chinensis]
MPATKQVHHSKLQDYIIAIRLPNDPKLCCAMTFEGFTKLANNRSSSGNIASTVDIHNSDGETNPKLGDFDLAKLCDHGVDPQTSRHAGTLNYIAQELVRTGKASTHIDVYLFGAFLTTVPNQGIIRRGVWDGARHTARLKLL